MQGSRVDMVAVRELVEPSLEMSFLTTISKFISRKMSATLSTDLKPNSSGKVPGIR